MDEYMQLATSYLVAAAADTLPLDLYDNCCAAPSITTLIRWLMGARYY